jgi:hypothetical protein
MPVVQVSAGLAVDVEGVVEQVLLVGDRGSDLGDCVEDLAHDGADSGVQRGLADSEGCHHAGCIV